MDLKEKGISGRTKRTYALQMFFKNKFHVTKRSTDWGLQRIHTVWKVQEGGWGSNYHQIYMDATCLRVFNHFYRISAIYLLHGSSYSV